MDVQDQQDAKVKYTTPRWVQAWFLGRSRARWKKKYQELKVKTKQLQNRVNDVTKSREKWREEAKQLSRRIQELESQPATVQKPVAASKKDGPDAGGRPGR
jgi:peptidoglycan hydrolase CwlO-like protein